MRGIIANSGWLLSPTRKIIDLWKARGDQVHRGNALRRWSLGLFCIEAIGCVALILLLDRPPSHAWSVVGIALVVYAYSRVNEIAYAFYLDPLSRRKDSDLEARDRIVMAMRSYFGVAFNFAVLYYFLPITGLFKGPDHSNLGSFTEAFYFSGVTLATLGYGDITPIHAASRLLAVCEVFIGILIIAVAVATYIGGIRGADRQPVRTSTSDPPSCE